MKIALVNGNPGWGGGEQWFLDASEALARRGHDLTLAAWSEGPLFQRSVRSGKKTYALRALPQVLLDHKPHVVLCNNGRDLRRVLKAGVHPLSFRVVLRRGIDRPLKDTIFRRPSWKNLSTILVNSDATKGTVERSLPWFPKDRIQRLHNPVAFTPLSRVAETEGTFRFGAAGRLVKQKGFDLLLRAFARMDASLACTLDVAGEGKQRSRLEKLHRRLNLGARCRLLGHVRDMPSFYARLDGLVMPSRYEGFVASPRWRRPWRSYPCWPAKSVAFRRSWTTKRRASSYLRGMWQPSLGPWKIWWAAGTGAEAWGRRPGEGRCSASIRRRYRTNWIGFS